MDKHMRWFIVAAVIYFLAGAVLGLGIRFSPSAYYMRFVHVHLMLLGFMAMMIYGIGYFIIPRFNATTLRWPHAVAPHFWLSNIALLGMVSTYSLLAVYGSPLWQWVFTAFSSLQVFTIAIFVFNLALTITGRKGAAAVQPQPKKAEPVRISGDMPVGEIIDKWPAARKILVEAGLRAVADDSHLQQIKQMGIPLRMACMRHGIDLNSLINRLTKALSDGGEYAPAKASAKKIEAPIRKEHIIGDVLASFPQTEGVFRRYFGQGCFDCPGQSIESVSMSASLHNLDENELLEALNGAIAAGEKTN